MEYRAAAFVAERLTQLGFEVVTGRQACLSEARMGVPHADEISLHEEMALNEGVNPYWLEQMRGGHTAVVGIIRGSKPGPIVALRFDMDCVEVGESQDPAHAPVKMGYRSRRQGLMHACGHDGHIAIGVGTAVQIAERIEELTGEIRLLFQPAEEGCRGAKAMIEAGWLDDVDYFFGGHIGLKSRTLGEVVASSSGFLSTTKLDVVFRGKAAHAGESPELGRNALLAACSASLHLHSISRHSGGATRIHVGQLVAGTGRNVIAEEAHMKLETRGVTEELNAFMLTEAVRILEGTANVYGVVCQREMVGSGVSAEADTALIPWIQRECERINRIHTVIPTLAMGVSEDASLMLRKVKERGGKAAYLMFGSPLTQGHHQPCFDFDEEVLGIAAELLIQLVFACPEWTVDKEDLIRTTDGDGG